jgi:hypothetical protein
VFSHLAGNQIILVITGYGNEHVSSAGTYFIQGECLATVATNTDVAQFIVDDFTEAGILFHNGYFMTFAQ